MASTVQPTITSRALIRLYRRAGIDVSRFFAEVDRLYLEEHPSGLLSWSPSVVGDAELYSNLSRVVPHYYPHDKPEYRVALPWIAPGNMVLEVGCGEGCFGELLPAGEWFGVDINPDAIRLASGKGLRCRLWNFLEDDISRLPQRQFACICSFQMIEHLPDPGSFFEFASRHLAPGGRLILGAPAMDSLLGKQPMTMLNLPPHHQTWWTDRALRHFPESYGFVCEQLIHAPLDVAHHRAYLTLLLKDLLSRRLNRLPALLAEVVERLGAKPISVLTRLLVDDGSIDPVFGARGQSVVSVYRRDAPRASSSG
jgi:SAM-dependent methyltransferase